MCPQFNSKQAQGTYKQYRDNLGRTTVPTLGRGSQSSVRGSIHLLYKRDYVLTTSFALLGRSSNDEDERNENLAKKWICVLSSRLFGPAQFVKCGRFFLQLNSNGIYRGSKRERKIRHHMFTSSIKRRIRRFDVVVGQWTSKKCTKKHDARAELLFCS